MMARPGGRGVVLVGLLWRSGAESCPDLLQRRLAAGSAADRSAEYQRFSPRAPVRFGPLQQIWTTGARHRPRKGRCESSGGRGGRPRVPRRALCTRKCSSNRHSRVQNAHLDEEGAGRGPRGPRRPPRPHHHTPARAIMIILTHEPPFPARKAQCIASQSVCGMVPPFSVARIRSAR